MLLLLDIDGVMVQAASWKKVDFHQDGFFQFMPNAVNNLRDIISETGATIVLTTSHKSAYPLDRWREIFSNRGIIANVEKLEDNIDLLSRKDEILNWLSKTEHIEDYVIIDDDKSLHDLPKNIKEKVVFTQALVGLNKENATSAIEILNKAVLV
ncbi:MAG: hypothetical protein A3D31_06115 [Candidatus Fluviicola riflensis]|nr:MAG: hypothetical protein CHH17_08900 [Candidatus Fluviicola riflensis]OGS79538.1 MAG: hypothetical protein A3D31_06115 [Candidatus Fluviicola riflensis]OGS86969.1 MAG: hypothetical protein A2724_05575 [Fluviicola sp. RIFCSPHIGHO2_01_FULL_43_53]OGS89760.1 MAG: hypothetical protein A3E30_02320 [Fluviicola sp. RIFCSPHIGHO2_12_FULL_43_24]